MKYDVVAIPPFDHQLKRLVKKFPSLKTEFANLVESLEKDPTQGKAIGNHCYKIRLAIKSKGKGKSGGVRLLPTSRSSKQLCFYLPSTTNQSNKIFLIKKLHSCYHLSTK